MNIWRQIEGFEDYEVSCYGQVRSRKKGKCRILSQIDRFDKRTKSKSGYKAVHLYREGKRKTFFVHTLVAQEFVYNPEGKPYVNHKDGIKDHNFYSNLEWVTFLENMQHAHKTGLIPIHVGKKGSSSHFAKLSSDDVEFIRKSSDQQKVLAKMFGVCQSTISYVRANKTWSN